MEVTPQYFPPDVLTACGSLAQGAGTTESMLTEIFASRSNRQIKALSEAYLAGESQRLTGVTQMVVKPFSLDYCEIFCFALWFKKLGRH